MTAILKVDTIQDTSGNNIINENANTITIGKAGDTTNIVGTLQNDGAALISGITNAQQWRPTTTTTGSNTNITSWEKVDTSNPGYIGSDMTLTNGGEYFNFPTTGIWFILFRATMYISGGASYYMGTRIQVSTDGGSNWSDASLAWDNGYTGSAYATTSNSIILDVTNTSNVLVRAGTASNQANTVNLIGNSNQNETEITFIRLGDT